jgi:hypothetical protein
MHLDIYFNIKLSALHPRLLESTFMFNFFDDQMHALHVAKLKLSDIAGLRSFELISFCYNLLMIVIDQRILPRFLMLMQAVILYNESDGCFRRNESSLILHLFI